MEENLQTSPWIWCVSVIETFTFVLMCVCVGVCHISQNCTKKNPEIEKRKTESFHGPCDVIVDVDDDRKEKTSNSSAKEYNLHN